ncbi:hypothetical protein ABZX95_46565, partial [Streptomyces sp. NPDC004232]|uniref:hypothetical protein n=1 Tax=Streptomyces sp. NPDC004232 TaxID=3154454 RepID=UPI0033AF0A29
RRRSGLLGLPTRLGHRNNPKGQVLQPPLEPKPIMVEPEAWSRFIDGIQRLAPAGSPDQHRLSGATPV